MFPTGEDKAGSLAHFHAAQAQARQGYATALAEIRAGWKWNHWIWYIFPQLGGLGFSWMAERYAIEGAAMAEAYLRDPVLGERLAEITKALEEHVCASSDPKSLVDVLGEIDAMKVVSSLTLFSEVGRRLKGSAPPWVPGFRRSAERVLKAAAREGLDRCEFTLQALAAAGPG